MCHSIFKCHLATEFYTNITYYITIWFHLSLKIDNNDINVIFRVNVDLWIYVKFTVIFTVNDLMCYILFYN